MEIRKLTESFYKNNTDLKEALDLIDNVWTPKIRGYGIVVIEVNDLMFGIPLRTRIKKYRSKRTRFATRVLDSKYVSGLDYGKAVLLTDPSYVSDETFYVKSSEYRTIRDNTFKISKAFGMYVNTYINARKKGLSIVIERDYRFTTLINYHNELGLEEV